jgi:hypothetical protein
MTACCALFVLQTLPFLKAAQPGALKPLLENGFTTVDMAAVQAFAQKTLVPMVRSSASSSAAVSCATADVHVTAETAIHAVSYMAQQLSFSCA